MNKRRPKSSRLLKVSVVTGKGAWALTKGTIKVLGVVGKPMAEQGSKLAVKGAQATTNYTKAKIAKRAERKASITASNCYQKAATSCEDTLDALLNQRTGTSERVVRTLATKFGFAGATVGVFSIASLLGTASTGTAISTLSGAAFQSAALAWIGGSVATGGLIVFGVGIAGGAVAYLGARYGLNKITGKKRKEKSLDEQERRVVETCLYLAASFRQQQKAGRLLDPTSASVLHEYALKPLSQELGVCLDKVSDWPAIPLNRLSKEVSRIVELDQFLETTAGNAGHKLGMIGVPIATGVVSATVLKLLGGDLANFTQNEELVLEALRRSNSSLNNASNEELAVYVQGLEVEQIAGLTNNVKGIYHELRFQERENTDGDEYIVELFEDTNHPGADVRIINTETGEITTVQLKATNYAAYVREHNDRYRDIDIFATSEVADQDNSIPSSGFPNEELTRDTESVLGALREKGDQDILDSMGVAAMVILARSAGAFLKGKSVSTKQKEQMIKDGIVAASVAGLTNLVL
jgi:hypothetical protein